MFGTLSYDAHTQEPVFEAVTTLPSSISGAEPSKRPSTIHKACQLCRARKLRCSGEPSGCERCRSSFSICRYPPRSSRAGKRRDLASPGGSSKSREARAGSAECAAPTTSSSSLSSQRNTAAVASRDVDRPAQLQWQHDPSAMGFMDQEALSLSHFARHCDTDDRFGPTQAQPFPSDGYVFSSPEDHTAKDYFAIMWQNHDSAFLNKNSSSFNDLQDLSFDLPVVSTGTTADSTLASPGVETPDLEASDMPCAGGGGEGGAALGSVWASSSVDTSMSPELSSRASVSRSHSVDRNTTRTRITDARPPTDGENCQCLGRVARFLEQVETGSTKPNRSMDDLFECSREPLRHRDSLLACTSCTSRSEYTLLLTMLAKSLGVVCCDLVNEFVQQMHMAADGDDDNTNNDEDDDDERPTAGGPWPDLRLGTYLIQDSTERSAVMKALIAAKLDHLLGFMANLAAGTERREGRLMSLSQVEESILDAKRKLSSV